jgi:SAM-dependent methyltransferase
MTPQACPACGAAGPTTLDHLPTTALIQAYRAQPLEIDISPLFAATDGALPLQQCGQCSLKWYADAPAGDAAFYVALQRQPWYYLAEKAEYHFAARQVGAGHRVLEVGCGGGAFRGQLPAEVSYRGLEFNALAVESARAAGLDVDMRSIAEEAEARPGYYDVVCHFQVLEHVEDPAQFMRDCARALKPGGRLVVGVPAEDSFLRIAESNWLNMPPHHLTRWSDRALDAAFRRVGIEPIERWHESVANIHRAWHRDVVCNAGWLRLFGARPALLARPVAAGLRWRVRRFDVAEQGLYHLGLRLFPQASRGHTLCMAGMKGHDAAAVRGA